MTVGKVSHFIAAHSLVNERVCIFADEDIGEFLRLACDEGGIDMIVWYEYCRAGEQKFGAGGWRDNSNEGFMWAETQLFEAGLKDKTPQEILRYIGDFRGEYSEVVLFPEFYISRENMEKVLTIDDWWDGPLTGLCLFGGEVCIYERVFDTAADEYSFDEYWLTPVTESEQARIMEYHEDWVNACSSGDLSSYYSCHDRGLIGQIIGNSSQPRKYRRRARFSGGIADGYIPDELYVEWSG